MTESSTDMSFQYPYRINNIRKGEIAQMLTSLFLSISLRDKHIRRGGATNIDKKYRTFQYPYGIKVLERARPANPCSYGVKFQGSANLPF